MDGENCVCRAGSPGFALRSVHILAGHPRKKKACQKSTTAGRERGGTLYEGKIPAKKKEFKKKKIKCIRNAVAVIL